jgi:hypothetical protein
VEEPHLKIHNSSSSYQSNRSTVCATTTPKTNRDKHWPTFKDRELEIFLEESGIEQHKITLLR